MVSGVAQVQVYGSQKYAVRVQLDPGELASRGAGHRRGRAVDRQSSNVNLPTGTLYGTEAQPDGRGHGPAEYDAAEYRPIIVAWRKGRRCGCRSWGGSSTACRTTRRRSWFNGERADHAGGAAAAGHQHRRRFPCGARPAADVPRPAAGLGRAGSDVRPLDPIRASVHDVKFTLVLTLALVVLVIFLFLRNLSATMIPSLALPMSIVGTFAVMYLLGYSLDNLSLMALTLSVGFVVDDAIVMLENIYRHMEMGKSRCRRRATGRRRSASPSSR
jgi:HAE1 family hydrophobic/amphiphilic exporter-1